MMSAGVGCGEQGGYQVSKMSVWKVTTKTHRGDSVMTCLTSDYDIVRDWASRMVCEFGFDQWRGKDLGWLLKDVSSFVVDLGNSSVAVSYRPGLWDWLDGDLYNDETGEILSSPDSEDGSPTKLVNGKDLLNKLPTLFPRAQPRFVDLYFNEY